MKSTFGSKMKTNVNIREGDSLQERSTMKKQDNTRQIRQNKLTSQSIRKMHRQLPLLTVPENYATSQISSNPATETTTIFSCITRQLPINCKPSSRERDHYHINQIELNTMLKMGHHRRPTQMRQRTNRSHGVRPNHLYYHQSILAIIVLVLLQCTTTSSAQAPMATTTSTTIRQQQNTTPTTVTSTAASKFLYNDNVNANNTVTATATRTTTSIPHQVNVASDNNQNGRPIEEVAKAEALTSAESSPQPQTLPIRNKLFEVCKLQSRTGQFITNLSQIMFQPSDICSTWSKMSRSTTSIDSSMDQPWLYIEQLSLSQNNLTVLHDSSGLGRLINLIELKITHNQLSRCEELSLFGLQQLQILDLSHNKLMALPAKFFQPVKLTLKKLNLSSNSISVLVPNLFDNLSQLEYLDLSHNDITSHWISDRLFKNLTQLRYLDLSFNKLTVFSSPMTFNSLQQLETLSLQHNELRQVPETIQYLRYLSSLDLSQNLIHDITNASYLSNCHLLFNLNLESNLLENITRDAFSDLPALKVLNLANNRIRNLDPQAFDYVPDLHALRLDSNNLADFGQAVVNLRFLLMLNISSNQIESFDYAQIPLGLQWLDLHSNKIDKLNNFYLSPTAQQQYSSNDINGAGQQQQSSIGQQWQSMLRLTTLDASFNHIRELDNTSLPESLETVQLNNNHIRNIASLTFSTKSNLTKINLSHNQLTTMPFDALKLQHQQQQHRDVQQQQKFVDIYLANNPFVCNCNMGWLSQLLLASSNLMQLGGANQQHNIQNLNNLPQHDTFTDIFGQVISRQLPRIADAHSISCHLPFNRHQQTLIGNNNNNNNNQQAQHQQPSLWWPVLAAQQLALHHNHLHHSRETLSMQQQQTSQPLILRQSELLASVHLCPYKSHCMALCNCCEFDACDCEMSCPENCSCYYDKYWDTNIVDCSANNQINGNSQTRFTQMMMGASPSPSSASPPGHNNVGYNHQQSRLLPSLASQQQQQVVRFSSIPEKIPMDVTELYLDGLELLHLRGNALIGRKNLKSLYLNGSQLYSIEPKALATQKSLRVLQLNSNHLTKLFGYEFEQQVELRELYLAHNQLQFIANTTFSTLKSLQILHLQNNQLYHMNFWSNLPNVNANNNNNNKIISFNLGQNPWSCQCDFIDPMLQWLQVNVKHLHDRKSISCQYNSTSSLHLLSPMVTSQQDSEASAAALVYANENYPMFDVEMCLNYTVYPVQQQHQQPPYQGQPSSPSPAPALFFEDPFSGTNVPMNPSNEPPNDEPDKTSNLPTSNLPTPNPLDPHYQFPPISGSSSSSSSNSPTTSRLQLLSPAMLLALISLVLLLVVASLPLIHYRRSMRHWIYSNYGMNLFSAANKGAQAASLGKSHHHHHHNAHLHHHQYGGAASSVGSTSSSSAASSNLSQALFHQTSGHHHHQQHPTTAANPASNGLVTTPLIVTNSNMNINRQLLVASPAAATYSQSVDDSKLFDAYLTYSKADEQFVNDFIAPELEYGQPSYRVALHYRDLPVTTSEFLTDCIIETANASRKIIMVISEQLLQSEWQRYEFRSAHLEALRSNSATSAQNKRNLIVVLLGQPNLTNLLGQELVQLMKGCTCISWGDKMFWQRLRFALPEQAARQTAPASQQAPFLRYQTLAAHQQQQQSGHYGKSSAGLLAGKLSGLLGGRPLPSQPNSSGQQADINLHLQEHHYAHLTPATMIHNGHQPASFHQPIYGDPSQQQQQQQHQQQQQQQQQQLQRPDNQTVPVHI